MGNTPPFSICRRRATNKNLLTFSIFFTNVKVKAANWLTKCSLLRTFGKQQKSLVPLCTMPFHLSRVSENGRAVPQIPWRVVRQAAGKQQPAPVDTEKDISCPHPIDCVPLDASGIRTGGLGFVEQSARYWNIHVYLYGFVGRICCWYGTASLSSMRATVFR